MIIDRIEITVKHPQPILKVFGKSGKSVQVILETVVPFGLEAKTWGTEEWYKGLAFGLQLFLGLDSGMLEELRRLLPPKAPKGRVVRFFKTSAGKRPEVIDPKR